MRRHEGAESSSRNSRTLPAERVDASLRRILGAAAAPELGDGFGQRLQARARLEAVRLDRRARRVRFAGWIHGGYWLAALLASAWILRGRLSGIDLRVLWMVTAALVPVTLSALALTASVPGRLRSWWLSFLR